MNNYASGTIFKVELKGQGTGNVQESPAVL